MNLPWVEKYRPKVRSHIRGQDIPTQRIFEFVQAQSGSRALGGSRTGSAKWGGRSGKKSVIIWGRSGTGKTSIVYAVATELGFEVLEVNASDFRDAKSMASIIGPASTQASLFHKGKIILVDEIDCLTREDRGGSTQLLKLISNSRFPVIMTANDPYGKKLSSIRRKSDLIQLEELSFSVLGEVLKGIRDAEKSRLSDEIISELSVRCGGDLRSAITDMQCLDSLAKIREVKTIDVDSLGERMQKEQMISALTRILKTTDLQVALDALDNVQENPDDVFLWIEENVPNEYSGADLARAFDFISYADVLRGRIRRRQYWRLLAYIMQFLTAGVAISKDAKNKSRVKYKQGSRILKMWIAKNKWKKAIDISKIFANRTHTSSRYARTHAIPYIRIACNDPGFADELAEELELEDEHKDWLTA